MATPEIAVVCSTFNRADRLHSLLDAFEHQTLDRARFEVVIVDDGSQDDTASVLRDFAARTSLQLRCVRHPVNQGRSRGRNAGWRASAAPLVAFTDDDCAPDPEWLRAGLEAMSDPQVSVVVGRTQPNPDHANNEGPFSRTQHVTESAALRYMHLCNVFYRRSDLESVGGVDERFTTKGGEDTDLGIRVLERGGAVVYEPDALVLHDITRGSFRAAMREALMWRDIPLVVGRHPKRLRPLMHHWLFWKRSHEYVVLAMLAIVGASALRNAVPLLGVVPWLYFRLRKAPLVRSPRLRRVTYLPHAFVLDAVEVSTMVRGSMKSRTLLL